MPVQNLDWKTAQMYQGRKIGDYHLPTPDQNQMFQQSVPPQYQAIYNPDINNQMYNQTGTTGVGVGMNYNNSNQNYQNFPNSPENQPIFSGQNQIGNISMNKVYP